MGKNTNKHPILANGEYYIQPIIKKNFNKPKDYPHKYDEAKGRLVENIDRIQKIISTNTDEIFVKEKVVCVRLEPKFEAKSYEPRTLTANSKMKLIGGRKYTVNVETDEKAKLYFIKTTNDELENLKNEITSGKKDHVKAWRNQACTIRSIDLLHNDEKVMGFDEEWNEGTVEIILHPWERIQMNQ